jgi:hypothetical protein
VVFHTPVDASDQLHAFVDEEMLDLPVSTLGRLQVIAGTLGFEPALEALSILAARITAAGAGLQGQIDLAEMVYGGGPLLEKIRIRLRENPGSHVFAEQHVYTLMQLLIFRATPMAIDDEHGGGEPNLLKRALLGVSSIVGDAVVETNAEFSEEAQWLPFLIQLAFFYANPQLMEEMTRAEITLESARSAEARAFESYCPVHDWYRDEPGLSAAEQSRLMMTFAAICDAFDGAETKTHVRAESLDGLLHTAGLSEKRDVALSLISATRDEFREMFGERGDDSRRLIWELRPFKAKPFLRCENGDLVLLSPRFVESWFSEGFHYRALDVAQDKGIGPRYTAFAGRLYESYCVRLMKASHEGMPGVEVHGDLPYRKGKAGKTCDVTIDYVTDLVLIEATNSRFRADTLVKGDHESAVKDLERVLIGKCRQLNICVDRILGGDGPFPADLSQVRNVWPVVVSAGVPMQTPPLWNYLISQLPDAFQQARVRPLTLVDPEEYELLCGLVESGVPLPDLLARKTQAPYRFLDLKAWLHDDPQAPRARRRPKMIREAFERSTEQITQAMNFAEIDRNAA